MCLDHINTPRFRFSSLNRGLLELKKGFTVRYNYSEFYSGPGYATCMGATIKFGIYQIPPGTVVMLGLPKSKKRKKATYIKDMGFVLATTAAFLTFEEAMVQFPSCGFTVLEIPPPASPILATILTYLRLLPPRT